MNISNEGINVMRKLLREIMNDPEAPEEAKIGFQAAELYRSIAFKVSAASDVIIKARGDDALPIEKQREIVEYLTLVDSGLTQFMKQEGIEYDDE